MSKLLQSPCLCPPLALNLEDGDAERWLHPCLPCPPRWINAKQTFCRWHLGSVPLLSLVPSPGGAGAGSARSDQQVKHEPGS